MTALLALISQRQALTQSSAPYNIADLGALGGAESQAFGINNDADVVGSAQRSDGTTHAFLFSGTTLRDLGTVGGTTSAARAVNRNGTVVGWSLSAAGNTKAFVYANGAMQNLGTLGGSHSRAYAINDLGDIVGSASTANNAATRAFLFRNGVMAAIGTTFGGTDSVATAINQYGEVAGYASTSGNGSTRAFLLQGGVTTNLGTLGGASEALGINDYAEVVGRSVVPSGAWHAFRSSLGTMTDLGTLGGANSEAADINNWFQIVGSSQVASGARHAFLYRGDAMIDLNTRLPAGSGWVLEAASSINDAGEIVGYGIHNGVRRAFRLTEEAILTIRAGGSLTNEDSNVPHGGREAGRNLLFVTTVTSAADNTARNIVFTGTLAGPAEIVSVRSYQGFAQCDVAGNVVGCTIPALGPISAFDEEIHVLVRVTGPGVLTFTRRAIADNAGPVSVSEENIGIALSNMTLSTATVAGGKSVNARVDLTSLAPPGGAVVRVTSSNPTLAPVPSQVIVQVPTNWRSFNIFPAVVSQPTPVTITATYGLVTLSRTFTVVPPALSSASLSGSTLIGGCRTATAKVTLTGSAPPGGAAVSISTTTTGANVPPSLTVPAGATSASFTVTTSAVNTVHAGTFNAAYGGVSKSLSLTVRPIYLTSTVLSPSSVVGGASSNGVVTSECAAPPGGLTVVLASTNSAVAAPTVASIVLPQGATSGGFTVRTSRVGAATSVSIRGTAHQVAKGATLTVQP